MKFDVYARWASLAVILGIAVLRATLAVLPIVIFDVDPARELPPTAQCHSHTTAARQASNSLLVRSQWLAGARREV